MKVKTFKADNIADLEKMMNDFYKENPNISVLNKNYQTATFPNMMCITISHFVILTYRKIT